MGMWIAGESYAGVYVPTLALQVVQNPSSPLYDMLQGFLVGNPIMRCKDVNYDVKKKERKRSRSRRRRRRRRNRFLIFNIIIIIFIYLFILERTIHDILLSWTCFLYSFCQLDKQ